MTNNGSQIASELAALKREIEDKNNAILLLQQQVATLQQRLPIQEPKPMLGQEIVEKHTNHISTTRPVPRSFSDTAPQAPSNHVRIQSESPKPTTNPFRSPPSESIEPHKVVTNHNASHQNHTHSSSLPPKIQLDISSSSNNILVSNNIASGNPPASPSSRRKISTQQLQQNLQALNAFRRSPDASDRNSPMDPIVPQLISVPTEASDWSNDNPFAFLKAPAPAPPQSPQDDYDPMIRTIPNPNSISNHHNHHVHPQHHVQQQPQSIHHLPNNQTNTGKKHSAVHSVNHNKTTNHKNSSPASPQVTFSGPTPLEHSASCTPSMSHNSIYPDLPAMHESSSKSSEYHQRKRPRSHSTSLKSRALEILPPPPKLVPPELPPDLSILTPNDKFQVQKLQSYFRGRIERAKVKLMIEKQVLGRRFTMEEILLSERRYVHHLDLIVNLFLKPLERLDLLSPSEISVIFINVDKLQALARSFLKQLEELFQEDPLVIGHRVGLLFLSYIPSWKIYSTFVNHFEYAQQQLALCKERKAFKEWLTKAETHTSLEKLGLMDYMIAAAKRIPQYELLLKAVEKVTPKSSRHYQTISQAKAMVTELAEWLNDRKKSFDNMRKITQIQRMLHGKIPNLATPGRELLIETTIKEELLDLKAQPLVERRVFLFNDCVLVATTGTNKFERLIYLLGAEMDLKINKKIILKNEDVIFIAVFSSENDKNKFASTIGHAIETVTFQEQDPILQSFAPEGHISKPKVVNSVVLKHGWLLKHRRSTGGWNKRWFVLEQGVLYYFNGPSKVSDITQRGTIELSFYKLRAPVDWSSNGKSRFGFELYAANHPVFVLASEHPKERNDWIQAIKPFLQGGKASDSEGILLAASSSAAKINSTHVLLSSLSPGVSPSSSSSSNATSSNSSISNVSSNQVDLIQWSESPPPSTASSTSNTLTSSGNENNTFGNDYTRALSSSKFYFDGDSMPRTVSGAKFTDVESPFMVPSSSDPSLYSGGSISPVNTNNNTSNNNHYQNNRLL